MANTREAYQTARDRRPAVSQLAVRLARLVVISLIASLSAWFGYGALQAVAVDDNPVRTAIIAAAQLAVYVAFLPHLFTLMGRPTRLPAVTRRLLRPFDELERSPGLVVTVIYGLQLGALIVPLQVLVTVLLVRGLYSTADSLIVATELIAAACWFVYVWRRPAVGGGAD